MKVSCMQDNLTRGLSIVGRAVAARSTLPILSNILLATDMGRLRLSATNLEISITCWVGAVVEEDGTTTLPARVLIDLVNALPPERIDMELAVRTQTLRLRCARFEANIKGIDAQEFPIIPTTQGERGEGTIALEAGVLREMIDQVAFAAATDESRPILTGVLARFEEDRLTMAAADGYRLSVRSAQVGQTVPEPRSVVMPARALGELARITASSEEPVELNITPARSQVLFHQANVDLVSQLLEGEFPDYSRFVPKTYTTRTVLDTQAFLKATRMANIFARDANHIIRIHIVPESGLAPGHVTISATSAELGDHMGELDAAIEGEEIELAFNANYLVDVLTRLRSAQVVLETTTPTSPGVIRLADSTDFVHVVMPMHLQR